MRKKLWIIVLAAVLPLVFNGCSKDAEPDEEPDVISLKVSEKTLCYEDEYQIEATSKAEIDYMVENEYHADVSATGVVTAWYVGETNVILSNGEDTKVFKVIVKPRSNLYPEPDVQFGSSRSSLKTKFGVPDVDTESGMSYTGYSSAAPILMLLFDSSNKLTGYAVMVRSAHTSALADFLFERYLLVTESEDTYFFINGLDPGTAPMLIGLDLYNVQYWRVLYMPNPSSSKSMLLESSGYTIGTNAFDELLKQSLSVKRSN